MYNIMQLASSALRGCIVAPPGRKLVVADLSNIEGRVVAWVAGEAWKLRAFADYDTVRGEGGEWITGPDYFAACMRGEAPSLQLDSKGEPIRKGHDLYKLAYAKSFGVAPEDVDKEKRQIGKVQELMLAYQGAVGAYITGAASYGIDLEAMAEKAQRSIPPAIWGQANILLEWHRKHGRDPAHSMGLSDRAWLVCQSFVLGWREGHPKTKQLWSDLEDAMRSAILKPGNTFHCGRLKVRRDGAWLRVVLPSGRAICYPGPALVPEKKMRKGIDADPDAIEDDGTGKTVISYMGMNQYSRRWERIPTYGGKAVENCIQAIARDVMAANMPAIEAAGYEIVLTVHDEIIAEAPDDPQYSADHLAALMATVPEWAAGMPLAAAGFESYRYKKD